MKQFRYIAILAAVAALSGCAKTEVMPVPEREIGFSVGSYIPATKASSMVGETTTFSTKAWLYAEGVSGSQDFFGAAGETIQWNSTSQLWAPVSHPYYWPKSSASYINFVSWYDLNGAPTTATQTSLVWSERTIAADDNIMFADEAWRYTDNIRNNPTYGFDGVTEGVPTLFHHALAKIAVRAIAKDLEDDTDGTNWAVTVTGVSISDVYQTGSLSMVNSDPNTASTTRAWTSALGAAPSWTLTANTKAAISNSGSWVLDDQDEAGDYTYIIAQRAVLPQAVSEDMILTVNFTVTTNYTQGGTSHSITEDVTATAALNSFSNPVAAWEMNKIITYNLIIDPATDLILFDPEMTDWSVQAETDIVID